MAGLTLLLVFGTLILGTDAAGKMCSFNGAMYASGQTWVYGCYRCTCTYGSISCKELNCKCPNGQKGICGGIAGLKCPPGTKCQFWQPPHISDRAGKCCIIKGNCVSNGKIYKDGSSWKVDCNTCNCNSGAVSCTEKFCGGGGGGSCTFNGTTYQDGQSWFDGCNNCYCQNGVPVCTLKYCGNCLFNGLVYPDGSSWKVDCNTCKCTNKIVVCTKMNCGGGNCIYKGVVYQHGSSWKDDCNTCDCNNKQVWCTKKGCGKGCFYKGKKYPLFATLKFKCYLCYCLFYKWSCKKIKPCNPCLYGSPYAGIDCGGAGPKTSKCPPGWECNYDGNPPFRPDLPGVCCKEKPKKYCTYNGKQYAHGAKLSFKCYDCTCDDGKWDCKKSVRTCDVCPYGTPYAGIDCGGAGPKTSKCPPGWECNYDGNPPFRPDLPGVCCKEKPKKYCTYNGKQYAHGAKLSFKCYDCTCDDGKWDCKKSVRTCDPCPYGSPYAGINCGGAGPLTSKCPPGWECNIDGNPPFRPDLPGVCCKEKPKKYCTYNGKKYAHGAKLSFKCYDCTCDDGKWDCKKSVRTCDVCPYGTPYAGIDCGGAGPKTSKCPPGWECNYDGNPPFRPDLPGVCCKKKKPCTWLGKEYAHGETIGSFKCFECTCDDGSMDCKPIVKYCNPCPNGQPGESCGGFGPFTNKCDPGWTCNYEANNPLLQDAPGVCCKDELVITSCTRDGKKYKDGEKISLKCYDCTCDSGFWDCKKKSVNCNPCPYGLPHGTCGGFTIIPVTCPPGFSCNFDANNPGIADLPGVCCRDQPVAKKCYYNGKAYVHGATLSLQCFDCVCKDGTWDCKTKPCNICEVGKPQGVCGGSSSSNSRKCPANYVCSYEHNHPTIGTLPGMCCPIEDVYKKVCKFGGKTYQQGAILTLKCFRCVCDRGFWDCLRQRCKRCEFGKPNGRCSANGGRYPVGRCGPGWHCNYDNRHPLLANAPGVCCKDRPKPGTCTHKGRKYSNGQTWRDGCNTCTCIRGIPMCTKKYCFSPCRYEGRQIKHNSVLRLKCFTCYCDDGFLDCEEKDCDICKYGKPGDSCGPYSLYPNQCPAGWSCNFDGVDPELMNSPGVCCRDSPDYDCNYKGKIYQHKERFMDGCLKCRCKKGRVKCSKRSCRGGGRNDCKYKAKLYANGDLWSDGCKRCSCAYRTVICAMSNCGCTYRRKPYKHGAVMKRGRKKCCACKNGRRVCGRYYCF